jgi:IS30 family transposase
MGYTHLSIAERSQHYILQRLGWSNRAIGKELGRHHSSIARERNRGNRDGTYHADVAHCAYTKRRSACKPTGSFTLELAKELEDKLQQTWSPEQIAEKRRASGETFVCFKTIYRWLYDGRLAKGEMKLLRHKGKRRKPLETRGRFLIGKPIAQRPKAVKSGKEFGHWELDTVVSSRGKSRACAATFIERKTRMYLAVAAGQFPQGAFRTATADRGKEFACYAALEFTHGMDVYFADPYSSWQRGSNENGNGLLREFFPKGIDLAEVSDQELAHALRLINNRPRKCLGWKSAHESYMDALSHLA